MNTRPAAITEIEPLFDIYRIVFRAHIEKIWGWSDDWQRDNFKNDFGSSSTSVVLVASKISGYMQTTADENQLYLLNIALHPSVQGQGLGTMLVKQLQNDAAEGGVPLNLKVFRTNPRAVTFYETIGFCKTGKTESHILMSWGVV